MARNLTKEGSNDDAEIIGEKDHSNARNAGEGNSLQSHMERAVCRNSNAFAY
jgi:hypothetical protein